LAVVAASAVVAPATAASTAAPPVAVAVASGLGGEQRRVDGALVAWPATVFG
jgi:hypothetical protein